MKIKYDHLVLKILLFLSSIVGLVGLFWGCEDGLLKANGPSLYLEKDKYEFESPVDPSEPVLLEIPLKNIEMMFYICTILRR